MSRWRQHFFRAGLSVVVVGGFSLLAAVAPWVPVHGSRRQLDAAALAPPRAAKAGSVPSPAPAPAGGFTLNGIPLHEDEMAVAACDPRTWDPFQAGFCAGRCTALTARRTAMAAAFAWRDAAAGDLHAVALSCDAPGGAGRARHVSIGAASGGGGGVGEAGGTGGAGVGVGGAGRVGWAGPLAGLGAAAGPLRPRSEPVPALPGATEVAHLDSGGLSVLVDRLPRAVSAGAALEELQLVLLPQGWVAAGGPHLRFPPDAPETRVFVRGVEVYVATLESAGDDSQPLLVSAYSRHGWAPEPSR